MEPIQLRIAARIPSKSNSYRITGRGLATTDDVTAYESIVTLVAREARTRRGLDVVFPRPVRVSLEFHWHRWRHDTRPRDLDGGFKATLDALTQAVIWDDDSQVSTLRAQLYYDQAEERDECLVLLLQPDPNQPQPTPKPTTRRSRTRSTRSPRASAKP